MLIVKFDRNILRKLDNEMVNADDAIAIYNLLSSQDIPIWLSGGWGIDALLGEQSRHHKDLDVILLLDDVQPLFDLLANHGYSLKELWSENLWAIDSRKNKVPTAFVLHDSVGRELDAHAIRVDEAGNGIPTWAKAEDFIFSRHDLSTQGIIAGVVVQCISADMQIRSHTGYTLPEYQQQDLIRLHESLGTAFPEGFLTDPST